MFKDTKGVIRICKSKKDRHYIGHMKKDAQRSGNMKSTKNRWWTHEFRMDRHKLLGILQAFIWWPSMWIILLCKYIKQTNFKITHINLVMGFALSLIVNVLAFGTFSIDYCDDIFHIELSLYGILVYIKTIRKR